MPVPARIRRMGREPKPTNPLDGRVIIVTGASRGIGKGLALGYAAQGGAVVCAARSARETPTDLPGTIDETVDTIIAAGGRAIAVRCDIGGEADLHALVDRTIDEFGRVDSLMNNAMAPTRATFDESTVDEWDESMRVNVRSLYLLTKLVEPHMTAQGGGSIINMSSHGADHAVTPFMPSGYITYSVAKAAMERFTTALAPELVDRGITVNALRPGAVRTELSAHELGEDHDWSGWTGPEAVVPAATFLSLQIATDFTGRIVDAPGFGISWP
jgi:NAD(P)-dependent dehydrogenase (short-subunit alcohol dehydrogenase family)